MGAGIAEGTPFRLDNGCLARIDQFSSWYHCGLAYYLALAIGAGVVGWIVKCRFLVASGAQKTRQGA